MYPQRIALLALLLSGLVLTRSALAQTGDDVACEDLKRNILEEKLKVNEDVLKLLNGSLQSILNCVPPKTKVVVNIPEYHIEERLTIKKSVSITSEDGKMLLGCDGMEIRSDDVMVGGLRIEGCQSNETRALIHIENAQNGLLENIECSRNKNAGNGPVCISLYNSMVNHRNISATRNVSKGKGGILQSRNSNTSLHNCKLMWNKAENGGAISIDGGNLHIDSCRISFNSAHDNGGGIYAEYGSLHVEKSFISSNTAEDFGGGLFGTKGAIHVTESTISSNTAELNGGGIHGLDVTMKVDNSNISSNIAYNNGGGIYAEGGNLHLENTLISFNTAEHDGGGIYGTGTDMTIVLSHFDNNTSGDSGGGFFSEKVKIASFIKANFTNNHAAVRGGGASISGKSVYNEALPYKTYFSMNQSWFASNTAGFMGGAMDVFNVDDFAAHSIHYTGNSAGNLSREKDGQLPNSSGGAIHLKRTQKCCFKSSKFSDNIGGTGGAVRAENVGLLELAQNQLKDNSAIIGGALSCVNVGRMTDTGSDFQNNDAYHDGGAISLVGSQISKTVELYYNYFEKLPYFIRFDDSQFIGNEAKQEGGGIHVSGIPFMCNRCTIKSNKAGKSGGGLRVKAFGATKLQDSRISHCSSSVGAGISLEDSKIKIARSNLTRNMASDVGGAIAAKFTSNFGNEAHLLDCCGCSIEDNEATRAGIIYVDAKEVGKSNYLDEYLVEMDLVSFSNNKVEQRPGPVLMFSTFYRTRVCCVPAGICAHGNDIQYLSCLDQGIENQTLLGTFLRHVKVSPRLISDYSSAKDIESFTVTLTDGFDNLAPVNASLTVKAEEEISGKLTTGVPITKESVVEGLVLRAVPGRYRITLEIESHEADVEVQRELVTVEVRSCTIGEKVVDNGKACEPCPAHRYNFGPQNVTCYDCKDNAICDGKTLVPVDGYWHSDSHSDKLHHCLNENACSYGDRTKRLRELAQEHFPVETFWHGNYTLCNKGYIGRLCGSCEKGYGRYPSGNCNHCHKKGKLKELWKILIVLASLVLLCFMVGLSIQSARSYRDTTLGRAALNRSQTTVWRRYNSREIWALSPSAAGSAIHPGDILKILINFFQVTATVTSVENEWQSIIMKVLDVLGWLSGMTSESAYFTLTCFFKGNNRFIFATLVASCLPLTAWVAFVVYGVIKFISRSATCKEFHTFCFVSAMAIVDISYLGWTKKMARIWYCREIDNESYWTEDTAIVCHGHPHKYLFHFLGLPLLVFVTLGFPAFVGLTLILSRRKLHTENLVSRYGYFYQVYRTRCAYWEVLIHLRKGSIAVIAVLSGGAFSSLIGTCLSLGVLGLAGALQKYVDPFKEDKLNTMEALSLFTSSFIFILASMLYGTDGKQWGGKGLTLLLLLVPIGFVVYMGFEYLNAWKMYLDDWLKYQEEYADYDGCVTPSMKTYCRVIYSQSKSKLQDFNVRMRSMSSGKIHVGRHGNRGGPLLGDEAGSSSQDTFSSGPLQE